MIRARGLRPPDADEGEPPRWYAARWNGTRGRSVHALARHGRFVSGHVEKHEGGPWSLATLAELVDAVRFVDGEEPAQVRLPLRLPVDPSDDLPW